MRIRGDKLEFSGTLELSIAVTEDELDGGYVVSVLELPGCMAQGETREEALHNIGDAIRAVLETRLEDQLVSPGNGAKREVVKVAMGPIHPKLRESTP